MTTNFRLSVLGLGVIAGLALLAELAAPIFAISSNTPESSRARSERLTQKRADAMVAEILKRPLFTDGRRPPEIKVAKVEPPKLQGRLSGVMLQPDFREAIFARPGGKPMSVKQGDAIDGWTVEKIETDQVLLTSAFGEQVIKPTNGGPDELTGPASRPAAKKAAPTQKGAPAAQPKKGTSTRNSRPASQAMAQAGSAGQ